MTSICSDVFQTTSTSHVARTSRAPLMVITMLKGSVERHALILTFPN